MFFKRKKKNEAVEVKAFFQGTALPLEQVKDPLFADKVMGDGAAIEPQDGTLYAPVSGTVATIFDTKHAIGYKLDNGADVLMHIGMDTVELEGKGFDLDISVGDKVQAGQLIGKIDLSYIKTQGKEVTTPVLLTTMDGSKI